MQIWVIQGLLVGSCNLHFCVFKAPLLCFVVYVSYIYSRAFQLCSFLWILKVLFFKARELAARIDARF